MNEQLLFFSAEAKSPAGKYLMNLIFPIETAFNENSAYKYSNDNLNSITIVFICTDEDMQSQGFFKERYYISWKKKYADIRLIIPYRPFISADHDIRKSMVWDVIERALDYLRMKHAFSAIDELENDLRGIYWKT